MRQLFKRFVRDSRGVSALEYAILAGLIVGAVAVGATALGTNIKSLFSAVNTRVGAAATAAAATK
jgi:pilus assembly protein Flp/PilA